MVIAKYVLPENESPRRKHHEEMVRRLISSPRSRCAANTYIYRAPTEEREQITGILNQWDKGHYSTKPTGNVINQEAVADIKEWCSNSGGRDLIVVKKFLQHLTDEQSRNNAEDEGIDTQRSGSGSPLKGTPAYSRGNSFQLTDRSDRPGFKKRDTITYGSFYPEPFEGRGNNTGMFNIVKPVPQPSFKRPATSDTVKTKNKPPSLVERQSTQPVMKKSNYFEIPTNRSGVFGEVIRPVPQNEPQENARPATNTRPPSNRPTTQIRPPSNRPSTRGQWNHRPETMAAGRQSSRIPVSEGARNRPFTQGSSKMRPRTQGSMVHKQSSSENQQKLKYSANLHDAKEEDLGGEQHYHHYPHGNQHNNYEPEPSVRNDAITPRYQSSRSSHRERESHRIDINHSPVAYKYHSQDNAGADSHRPIAVPRRCPGRYWQPSQIF